MSINPETLFTNLIIPQNDDCQRLFHGRGHRFAGFEHICIDWFKPVVLITLYKETATELVNQISEFIQANITACQSIQVQSRHLMQAPIEVVWGQEIDALEVTEAGLKYGLTLGRSQNHGIFLDIKYGRDWVRQNSQGKRVLNLFSYTCAFSIAAHAGGAKQILNLDMSRAALNRGRENHHLNQQDTSIVKFESVDLFKSFGRVRKHGPYDLLICDPPAFQKGSVKIERDYKKIIRRIPEFMADGALIMLCLNSPDLDEAFLTDTVTEYCPECQFVEQVSAPEVFTDAIAGKGLKVFIYKYSAVVLSEQ
ncbi:class I SAM-dependent methyltransferase [Catenovulum maritimum]|uniref:class I SAM-dependent methyltransferase n=1 Tax=Catenovulum maritimum TaxID=1513271 RepID=UPI00069CBFF7|nr:class I SAM-dependent methyltransferase [Catenovulum maritimum]